MTTTLKQNLEATLGTEQFAVVFEQVKALSVADAITLAKDFTFIRATSRTDALKRIWSRHMQVVVAKAKSRATAGRSAA